MENSIIYIENKSNKYANGTILKSNNYGEYVILERVKTEGQIPKFLIQFKDKTKIVVSQCVLSTGRLKNPNEPRIESRGYLGQGKFNSKDNPKEYGVWVNMIKRCYNPKYLIINNTYEGCTVDKDWLSFQNFCKDFKELKNYNEWIKPKSKYQLDKDIKIKNNKIYSKDTCLIVTQKENLKESIKKRISVKKEAYNKKTKEIIIFNNVSEFCKNQGNMNKSNVFKCLNAEYKKYSCKGWFFRYV